MTFVAICGVDGLGKTTLINNLKEYYPNENCKCVHFTHEPYDYRYVQYITKNMSEYQKMLVYIDDRYRHNVYGSFNLKNKLTICDRYMLSNIIYQGFYLAKENSADSYYEPTDAEPYQKLIFDMHLPEYFVHPDLTIVLYTNWDVKNEVTERIKKECDGDEDLYNDLGYINDDYMRSSYAYVKNKMVHICVDGRTPEEMCELVKREIDEVMNK